MVLFCCSTASAGCDKRTTTSPMLYCLYDTHPPTPPSQTHPGKGRFFTTVHDELFSPGSARKADRQLFVNASTLPCLSLHPSCGTQRTAHRNTTQRDKAGLKIPRLPHRDVPEMQHNLLEGAEIDIK